MLAWALILHFEDCPVINDDGVLQDLVMAAQRGAHGRPMTLKQIRAALDVGEQKGDRTGREMARHGPIMRPELNGGLARRAHCLRLTRLSRPAAAG